MNHEVKALSEREKAIIYCCAASLMASLKESGMYGDLMACFNLFDNLITEHLPNYDKHDFHQIADAIMLELNKVQQFAFTVLEEHKRTCEPTTCKCKQHDKDEYHCCLCDPLNCEYIGTIEDKKKLFLEKTIHLIKCPSQVEHLKKCEFCQGFYIAMLETAAKIKRLTPVVPSKND